MALEALRGQPRAAALLGRALETGRVAHAWAFVGPPGSGRTTAALDFAAALLCEQNGTGALLGQATHEATQAGGPRSNNPTRASGPRSNCSGDREPASRRGWPDPDPGRLRTPCACQACRLAAGGRHPDLHVLAPTPPEANPKGARAIRIGAVREMERQGALRPALGGRRVFVVDDADRMTGEAPEAILKFLEEPPPGTVVILILSRARAVPATVISRCQLVRFAPGAGADRAVETAAELAALVDAVRRQGAAEMFRRTERVDRDRVEALVDGAWLYARDRLRAGEPVEEIRNLLELCRRARLALLHNVSPRLTLEVVLSRLAFPAA